MSDFIHLTIKTQNMKNLIVLTFLFSLIFSSNAQTSLDSLTEKLSKISSETVVPGFAVAVVSRDKIHYKKSFGYADIATKKPYET